MKTIGLLGGMSWESTALYYQQINQAIQQELGKLHSAKIIMVSVDFAEIEQFQRQGTWDEAGAYLAEKAVQLEHAGAEMIVLCTNTMHKISEIIENATTVPLIHIADATASVIKNQSIKKIGLIGTAFTMEQTFYKDRLQQQGLEVIIPNNIQRKTIHETIYNELCLGVINLDSQRAYIEIVEDLIASGAQGIVMGCTEICMLIGENHFSVPLFNTTAIHAQAAVEFALSP